jgi:hypothetical protein
MAAAPTACSTRLGCHASTHQRIQALGWSVVAILIALCSLTAWALHAAAGPAVPCRYSWRIMAMRLSLGGLVLPGTRLHRFIPGL